MSEPQLQPQHVLTVPLAVSSALARPNALLARLDSFSDLTMIKPRAVYPAAIQQTEALPTVILVRMQMSAPDAIMVILLLQLLALLQTLSV